MDIGRGIMEIMMGLLGIALIALLVGKAEKTSQLVSSGANAFDMLLKTVTLQSGMSIG